MLQNYRLSSLDYWNSSLRSIKGVVAKNHFFFKFFSNDSTFVCCIQSKMAAREVKRSRKISKQDH